MSVEVEPDAQTLPGGDRPRPEPGVTVGRALGRYVVLGPLGRGGMGTVFKAYDESLDRAIAVKLLHAGAAERHAERLKREAQALAKLSHPNVVHVYEVGQSEGQWFIAMEMVSGQTLGRWQRAERGWKECVQVYLQAGEGLAAAHAAGLVHRDFKPDNCIIDDRGRVKVLDFGLVREAGMPVEVEVAMEAEVAGAAQAEVSETGRSLTPRGAVLGTLAYMPLEQLGGEPADARSDQFSFCVSLYEALYGERPFNSETVGQLTAALADGDIRPPPKGTRVPARLRRVLLRGLSVDPSDRWPTMDALRTALRRTVAPVRLGVPALASLGVLALVGIALWQHAAVERPCQGARAQLEGVWDADRRRAVESAILGTELSYASDTWDRVARALDEHADAWADKHTEVCEATSVHQEQSAEVLDLRMGCLQRRRVELRETVGVLTEANDTRVEKAVDLVSGLRGLSQCDDIEALRAELPPPDDPQVAEQVQAQRERLAVVRSLYRAGEFAEGLEESKAVLERARALGYVPLEAEAWFYRGQLRQELGQYVEAAEDLEKAYVLAAENRHERVEALASSQLAYVVGYRRVQPEHGLWWGTTALALSRGLRDRSAEARALNIIGTVLHRQGQFAQALDRYRGALAINEQELGPRHIVVANSLNNIGNALQELGQFEQARSHHQRALSIRTEALGAGHPYIADSVGNIGLIYYEEGKFEEALTHLRRALAIRETALGAEHPRVANLLTNIGNVLNRQGKLSEALEHQLRALTIKERTLGPDHLHVAISLNGIGNVRKEQGELEDAIAYYRRGLAIIEQAMGERHEYAAGPLYNIAKALMEQGKLDDALTVHRRALSIRQDALGPEHPDVADSLHNIGGVLERQGKLEAAREHQQRALGLFREALGARHPETGYPLAALARLAVARGDMDAARVHAEEVLSLWESGEVPPAALGGVRFTLAKALWADGGARSQAVELARASRDAYAELGDRGAGGLAMVEAWLREHGG